LTFHTLILSCIGSRTSQALTNWQTAQKKNCPICQNHLTTTVFYDNAPKIVIIELVLQGLSSYQSIRTLYGQSRYANLGRSNHFVATACLSCCLCPSMIKSHKLCIAEWLHRAMAMIAFEPFPSFFNLFCLLQFRTRTCHPTGWLYLHWYHKCTLCSTQGLEMNRKHLQYVTESGQIISTIKETEC
jgi:hypothetical protein